MNNLVTQFSPDSYPVDAFPIVVRNAITELATNIQAPLPLIGSSCLATMSAAVQGSAKIKLPHGGEPRPLALYLLVVAESGERKSTVDKLVSKPLMVRDQILEAQFTEEMRKFQHEYEAWYAVKNAYVKRLTAAKIQNLPTEEWEELLERHREAEPNKPKNRRLIRQDLSERALLDAMEGKGVSLVVMSAEGDIVLRSPLLQKNGVLNGGWGGEAIAFDRAKGVSFSARDTRMTVSLMAQPSAVREYLNRRGEMARGTGFFSRFLMSFPISTQGYRQTSLITPSWGCLDEFHRQINYLIEAQVANHYDDCDLILELDDDARMSWLYFIDNIELNLRPGQFLSDIRDFGSKAGEIAARLAGVFHLFSGQTGKISNDTMQRAIKLVEYHILEFKKLFSSEYQIPEWEVGAEQLKRYLHRVYFSQGLSFVERNHIYRYGPIRDRGRFADALALLVARGFVWISFIGKRKAIVNLSFNPFSQISNGF